MYELPSPMRVLCTSGKNCDDWSPTLRKSLVRGRAGLRGRVRVRVRGRVRGRAG